MKRMIAAAGLILATVFSVTGDVSASPRNKQSSPTDTACVATTSAEQLALNAAKNEARQMAEATNGGLSVYRAEPAMHGAAIASPCEMLGPQSWRFTIRGGDPTDVVISESYTILSVVTVEGTGRDRRVTLDYNGPIEEYVQ